MRHLGTAAISTLLLTWIGALPVVGQTYAGNNPLRQFPNYQPSSTVSPYLRLVPAITSDNQLQQVDGVYQTYVRPQLEQRETFQRQQFQISQLRTRLDTVQQPARQIGHFQSTGHRARFQSFTHFYPQLNQASGQLAAPSANVAQRQQLNPQLNPQYR